METAIEEYYKLSWEVFFYARPWFSLECKNCPVGKYSTIEGMTKPFAWFVLKKNIMMNSEQLCVKTARVITAHPYFPGTSLSSCLQ